VISTAVNLNDEREIKEPLLH